MSAAVQQPPQSKVSKGRDTGIRTLVRKIRRETGRRVPDCDPVGPGKTAHVLIVLRDPGDANGGALRTGVLSPTKNDDATARNLRVLMRRAGLLESVCLFWNAVPWDLERRNPTAADKRRGASYLRALLGELRSLKVVVASGTDAQEVCDLAAIRSVPVLRVCHPSNRGLSGGTAGARASRIEDYIDKLKDAARMAGAARMATQMATQDPGDSAGR